MEKPFLLLMTSIGFAVLIIAVTFFICFIFWKRRDRDKSALIVVDYQNDFCLPTGTLYVPGGETIVSIINAYIAKFRESGQLVIFSRDWHPQTTPHFKCFENPQGWPPHCIHDTPGAEFHAELDLGDNPLILSKGMHHSDAYSAFDADGLINGKTLDSFLRTSNVGHVSICGLATDHCVSATAKDALQLGYKVTILTDACKAVNLDPDDGVYALMLLKKEGAYILKPKKQ
jgi:nicotinamidase/pyrazinamidase